MQNVTSKISRSKILVVTPPVTPNKTDDNNHVYFYQNKLQNYDLIFMHLCPTLLNILEIIDTHTQLSCIIIDNSYAPPSKTKKNLAIISDIKSHFLTYHIPIIVIMNNPTTIDIIAIAQMGADDYVNKRDQTNQLYDRILLNIKRSQRNQHANPLTLLPGNALINKAISQRLHEPLAILYADLDNFKAYNDTYGFNKGDLMITNTASILTNSIKKHGNLGDFVGHIGGDDFILISTPDKAEIIAQEICTSFDTAALAQNCIHPAPKSILSLSIAILTNNTTELISVPQIAQRAAQLKQYVKTKPSGILGSNYIKEQDHKPAQFFTNAR
ncbi:MAG: diguanylate cyclase [bacterium]